MNFKEWEKVSEDNKTVTLKHPKGHQMTIALKGLPKIQQEQLKRLTFAKGGEVDEDGESEQGKTVRHANKMKARGEEHESEMQDAKEEAKGRASEERHVKPKLKGLSTGGRVNYDDGTPEAPVSSDDQKGATPPPQGAPTVVINTAAPAQGALNPQAPAPTPAVSQAPATPVPPIKLAEPKQVNGSSLGNEANKSLQGVEDAKTAIQNQATVDAAKAQALAPAAQEALESEQAIAKRNQGNRDMINNQTQQFNDFIAQHPIDPKHYQESQSAGAKVNTAIGLFVGGLGSAFGGTNYAFDHLEKQIDRDLHAQQQNVDNKKSVLGAWQNLYGSNNISDSLAKASMNDIYAKKVQLAGLQAGTAEAQIRAAQGVQQLQQKAEEYRNNAAVLSTKMGISGTPPGKTGPAASTSGLNEKQDNAKDSSAFLSPGASDIVFKAAKFDPRYKDRGADLNQQLKQATKVDGILNGPKGNGVGGIHDLMNQMSEAQGKMGLYGHLHSSAEKAAGALPLIGGAASAAGEIIPPTHSEKRYRALAANLESDLGTALQGIMTPTDIHEAVSKYLPAYQDTPEDLKWKEDAIRQIIEKAAVFPDLERLNAIKKRGG